MRRFVMCMVMGLLAFQCSFSACAREELLRVRSMPIGEVDLRRAADGVYHGDFSYGGFTYEVRTTLKRHRIEKIEIIRNRDSGYAKKAEGVVGRVLKAQSPNVDAISGATTTSKALCKAIENSLQRALVKK